MSLKIDPTSVHLGKNAGGAIDNVYVASYVPTDPATLPITCNLPPALNYTPGSATLIPLQPSCTYNFADVLGIPPTPPPPNPVPYKACESLTATSNIITTEATKNSSLSLVASGPIISETGTADCTIKLVGILDISACSDFSANSIVSFSNAAAGSSLAVTAASAPHCGVTLIGNIDISACESFTATSKITYGGALQGSYLNFVSRSIPDCGFDLTGAFNIDACETFNAQSNIAITGAAVKRSIFEISPQSTPNCGFVLTGDVVIDACTDFTATGGINFLGAAVKSSSVKVVAAEQPNCGLVLSGDVVIDACATFTAVNNFKITSSSGVVNTITPISIVSQSTPDCGFTLNGEVSIDACASANVSIIPDPQQLGFINLRIGVPQGQPASAGLIYSSAPLSLRSSTVYQEGCNTTLSISMDSIDLQLPGYPAVIDYTPGVLDGCMWEENTDGIYLYQDPYSEALYIAGAIPKPCFVCDSSSYKQADGQVRPFVYTDLELNTLSVNKLVAPQCCTINADNLLDLCNGYFQFLDINGAQVNIESKSIQISSDAYNYTQIYPSDIRVADAYRNAQLESGSLTLDDTSLPNSFMYATAHSLSYSDALNDEFNLTAQQLSFTAPDLSNVIVNTEGVYANSCAGNYAAMQDNALTMAPFVGSATYMQLTSSILSLVSSGTTYANHAPNYSYLYTPTYYNYMDSYGLMTNTIGTGQIAKVRPTGFYVETDVNHGAWMQPDYMGIKASNETWTRVDPYQVAVYGLNSLGAASAANITPTNVYVGGHSGGYPYTYMADNYFSANESDLKYSSITPTTLYIQADNNTYSYVSPYDIKAVKIDGNGTHQAYHNPWEFRVTAANNIRYANLSEGSVYVQQDTSNYSYLASGEIKSVSGVCYTYQNPWEHKASSTDSTDYGSLGRTWVQVGKDSTKGTLTKDTLKLETSNISYTQMTHGTITINGKNVYLEPKNANNAYFRALTVCTNVSTGATATIYVLAHD